MVRGGCLIGAKSMCRASMTVAAAGALVATLVLALVASSAFGAGDSTPAPAVPIVSMAVERSAVTGYIDLDPPGLSPGDRYTWGPNPLYDGENVIDTGVTVSGECAVFNL